MSDFYNKYPYTDFHELNLDWVIERVKKLTEDWAATLEEWNSTEEQWQDLYNYVHDYFDNLDVQVEINNKINDMIADGTFVTITTPVIEAKVASMMPGVVSDQIGGVVATQIGPTVASQIGATVAGQIDAAVVAPVNNWLQLHITQPTTPVVDTSLSIPGAAADAAVTGNAIWMPSLNRGYYTTTGDYVSQSAWRSTIDYMLISAISTFSIKSYNNVGSLVYYDQDFNYISTEHTASATPEVITTMNPPANAVYVRFSYFATDASDYSITYNSGFQALYNDKYVLQHTIEMAQNNAQDIEYQGNTIEADTYAYGIQSRNSGENMYNYIIANKLYEENKYVNNDGTITFLPGFHIGATDFIPVSEGDILEGTMLNSTSQSQVHWGCVYKSDRSLLVNLYVLTGGNESEDFKFEIPAKGAYIRLTLFDNVNTNYIRFVKKHASWLNNDLIYKTLARKPFNFSGKEGYFVGDSIAFGVTNSYPYSDVHNTADYPTLFCNATGMTRNNISVSGACYCSGLTVERTIPEQVQLVPNTADVLIIEGGINDWVNGATPADLQTTIENLCDYINSNFNNNMPVIWITPIDQGGWNVTGVTKMTIQDMRNIITRTVIMKDTYARFSIVQGNDFNFPTSSDDPAYVAAMYGDKLHPSALAYKTLYLTGLLNALC